jgi:hypothetical protein
MSLTIDQIKAKLPAQFGPVVDQYGAAFLKMTADEIWAWLTLALNGKADEAYRAVLAKLPNADLLAEWGKINDQWQAQNAANAASIAWQKEALYAILKVLVAIAIAAAGF